MSRLGLVLTAIATAAAAWLGWVYATDDVPRVPPAGDRVLAAVAGLKSSHVYVDPDSQDVLTPAELTRIDRAASAAEPEVFVVIWRESSEAGYYLPSEALDQIGAQLNRPGLYISAGAKDISSTDVGITSDDSVTDFDVVDYEDGLGSGELASGLLTMIEQNDERDFSAGATTGSQYWGGTAGTITAGTLIGSFSGAVVAGLLAIAWAVARSRRRTR